MLGLVLAAVVGLQDPSGPQTFAVPSVDGYVLNGQVDRPAGPSRGAVILVAGTGAFDRDVRFGTSGTPRDLIFADLGQRFAARGLSAVRYDRRGVRHNVPPTEVIDPEATTSVTAENLSRDVGALYDWTRSPEGLGAQCVVFFVHSEGGVHLAGVARTDAPPPALIIGMGAPLESKAAAVRWQLSGRDAESLRLMDGDGDGSVTNAEVEANWMRTPSAVFGTMVPFIQPDGVWTPEDIAMVETVQAGLYDQTKAAALALPDEAPYPNAQAPAFSQGWWKTWFTDDRPLAQAYAAWGAPMILHYGEIDSQVREARQRAAGEGVMNPGQVTFVSHAGRGHTLGEGVIMGPIDEAIAEQIADEAAAACPG